MAFSFDLDVRNELGVPFLTDTESQHKGNRSMGPQKLPNHFVEAEGIPPRCFAPEEVTGSVTEDNAEHTFQARRSQLLRFVMKCVRDQVSRLRGGDCVARKRARHAPSSLRVEG